MDGWIDGWRKVKEEMMEVLMGKNRMNGGWIDGNGYHSNREKFSLIYFNKGKSKAASQVPRFPVPPFPWVKSLFMPYTRRRV